VAIQDPSKRGLILLALSLWIGCDPPQPIPTGRGPETADAPSQVTIPTQEPAPAASSERPPPSAAKEELLLAPLLTSDTPSVGSASSSPLALARLGKRTVALLADEDEHRLRLLDLDAERELTSAPLAGAPGHVVIDDTGRIYVAVRGAAHVASFDVACAAEAEGSACAPELKEHRRIDTPPEPIALGFSRDFGVLLVSCGWGRALVGHPIREDYGRGFVAPLAREPRGFALDKSGRIVIVAHAVGSRVSLVSLDDGAVLRERALEWRDKVLNPFSSDVVANVPRHAVQGFAVAVVGERAHVPMVLAYPGDPLEFSGGYGLSVDEIAPYFPHEPALVVVDVLAAAKGPTLAQPPDENGAGVAGETVDDVVLRTPSDVVGADKSRSSAGRPPRPKGAPPCLLPRAAAVDPIRGTVLIACFDISAVIELRASAGGEVIGEGAVSGKSTKGMVSDASAKGAVSGSEDGRLAKTEIRRFSLGKGPNAIAIDPDKREAWVWSLLDRRLAAVPLDKPQAPPRAALTLPAGAHSREDAGRRAFHSPIAFDGRSCASCHIDGRDDGLVWSSPIGQVQTPVLAGRSADTPPHGWRGESATLEVHIKRGFDRLRGPKATDETLTALARYIATMPTFRAPSKPLTADQARGRDLFHAPEVACSACHAGEGVWTDGIRRDVGTGAAFDTPSLRFLGDTAPYMHDGRYATLRELLIASDGKMGFTRHLNDADMSALIAYLITL
jgi:mono/diheme cytochrome c family protein